MLQSTLDCVPSRSTQAPRRANWSHAARRRQSRPPRHPPRFRAPRRTVTSRTSATCWWPRIQRSSATSLLPADASQDPAARLDAVVRAFTTLILDTEEQQCTDAAAVAGVRPRRIPPPFPCARGEPSAGSLKRLEPLRDELGEPRLHALVLAIRSAIGIEALIWLTDVAALSRADAQNLMCWSAQSMLTAARQAGPPQGKAGSHQPTRPAVS